MGNNVIIEEEEEEEGDEGRDETRTSEETWERAKSFLRRLTEEYCALHNDAKRLGEPNVEAGPDGSVDIYWFEPTWNLIINVPADAAQWAVYSGEKPDRITAKGRVNTGLRELSQLLMFLSA